MRIKYIGTSDQRVLTDGDIWKAFNVEHKTIVATKADGGVVDVPIDLAVKIVERMPDEWTMSDVVQDSKPDEDHVAYADETHEVVGDDATEQTEPAAPRKAPTKQR